MKFFVDFWPIYNFLGAYPPIYFREAIVLARYAIEQTKKQFALQSIKSCQDLMTDLG